MPRQDAPTDEHQATYWSHSVLSKQAAYEEDSFF